MAGMTHASDVSESFLSSQSHKPFESKSNRWFARASQCQVKWNFTFFLCLFLLWNCAM